MVACEGTRIPIAVNVDGGLITSSLHPFFYYDTIRAYLFWNSLSSDSALFGFGEGWGPVAHGIRQPVCRTSWLRVGAEALLSPEPSSMEAYIQTELFKSLFTKCTI